MRLEDVEMTEDDRVNYGRVGGKEVEWTYGMKT